MSNSEPVYSFASSSSPKQPDMSGINEILSRHMRLALSYQESSSDIRLLELRHILLEKLTKTPECHSEVFELLEEVNDLLADCIYANEDRDAIINACLTHWKTTLLPHHTELCVESVRLKLGNHLAVGALIDIRFALESGIKHQIPWDDLLLETIGPVITRSDLSPERMRHAIQLIQMEYQSALQIATL